MSEKTRAYIYRISVAALPVLVAYGVLAENQVAMWLGLAGAVLGVGTNALASANTSTKSDER